MAKAEQSASIEELRQRIRESGLRCTTGRMSVLQFLEQAHTPLTHAEIAEHLVPQGYDKATVYRNLVDLAEVGLVVRSELGDHLWRFEVRRTDGEHGGDHAHFLCTTCGEVTCLSENAVSLDMKQAKNVRIGDVTEILLKGHCGTCKSK